MTPTEIKKIRQTLGLTQQALATQLGVSVYTVVGWEKGRRKPEAAAITLLKLIRDGRIKEGAL